jgi:Fe-S-cluster containining protein
METDLKKIKQLGEKKERENWEFRSFLKFLDIEMEELDSIVHNIYQEVSSQIDCKKCANYCKEIKPVLDQNDVKRFSNGVDLPVKQFLNQYIIRGEDKTELFFNRIPCPFLKDTLCSNYDFRPKDCRSYPHLDKKEFVTRLWSVVDNYSICPIVFNVYEILKDKLWQYNDNNIYDDYDAF